MFKSIEVKGLRQFVIERWHMRLASHIFANLGAEVIFDLTLPRLPITHELHY